MQSQLTKVSTRLGLVWLESRVGSGSFGLSLSSAWALFFPENEILVSASITKSHGSALKISASFTSLVCIHRYIYIYTYLYRNRETCYICQALTSY